MGLNVQLPFAYDAEYFRAFNKYKLNIRGITQSDVKNIKIIEYVDIQKYKTKERVKNFKVYFVQTKHVTCNVFCNKRNYKN